MYLQYHPLCEAVAGVPACHTSIDLHVARLSSATLVRLYDSRLGRIEGRCRIALDFLIRP